MLEDRSRICAAFEWNHLSVKVFYGLIVKQHALRVRVNIQGFSVFRNWQSNQHNT